MKNLFLVAAILFSSAVLGQTPEPTRHYIFCELVGPIRSFSNKVTVVIDYGQESNAWGIGDPLKDGEGNPIRFNSMVDAMNYMDADGWEFVQTYVTTSKDDDTCHWLLRRDVKDLTKEQQDELLAKFKVKLKKK